MTDPVQRFLDTSAVIRDQMRFELEQAKLAGWYGEHQTTDLVFDNLDDALCRVEHLEALLRKAIEQRDGHIDGFCMEDDERADLIDEQNAELAALLPKEAGAGSK